MPDTWIVTGGAGFIGCNFVRHVLSERDEHLVVIDKLTYAGSLENLRDVESDPRLLFVHGDIGDRELIARLLSEHTPTALLNFAAESHVDRSIDDPSEFVRTNVHGAFELLDGARRWLADQPPEHARRFRLLHVSTDEVFGSLGAEGYFTEETPYDPRSPYAASKAAADHLARAYAHTYGLPVLLTNCSNNYGPYQFPEKLIPLMILNAFDGRPLPVYGDGANVRDWLHVEDHCRGLVAALEHGRPGRSYNLGGRQERTNLEVVEAICAALEAEAPAAENLDLKRAGKSGYRELITFVEDRPGHDRRYAIDPRRAQEELGWSARHGFEEGLRETVRWYLDQGDWRDAIQLQYDRARLGTGQV